MSMRDPYVFSWSTSTSVALWIRMSCLLLLYHSCVTTSARSASPHHRPEPETVNHPLVSWMHTYELGQPLAEIPEEVFAHRIASLSKSTQLFLKIRQLRMQHRGAKWLSTSKDALHALPATDPDYKIWQDYLWEELHLAEGSQKHISQTVQTAMKHLELRGCPQKRYLNDRLQDWSFGRVKHHDIRPLMVGLDHIQDHRFKKNVLTQYFKNLPQEERPHIDPMVRQLAREILDISLSKYSWLKEDISHTSSGLPKTAQGLFKSPLESCSGAQQTLLHALDQLPLSEAYTAGKKIELCFKKKGAGEVLKFWQSLQDPFSKTYGFEGWGRIQVTLAQVLWNSDVFEHAKETLGQVLVQSRQEKNDTLGADALLMLARIEENQGLFSEAADKLTVFINTYPKHEHVDQARLLLMLVHIGMGEWERVSLLSGRMIQDEDTLTIDQRQVSRLGFALFWGGRAHLELGETFKALAYWKRLAGEFYSTYYGALGHYMVEQLEGHTLAMHPFVSKHFSEEAVFSSLTPLERQRIERIKVFLQFGLAKDAKCEIYELASQTPPTPKGTTSALSTQATHTTHTTPGPAAQTAKALFLHQTGEWLESIKLFGDIPRSYRKELPAGMEMLLFPKKFDEIIERYAHSLKLDPDFVLSLIRQESVFNPQAKSQAGAMGLMQLMQPTAQSEAKKVPHHYVGSQGKEALIQKIRQPDALLQLDTNILLGTHYLNSLLQKYGSPIFSLSAYNAGPTTTTRWLKKYPTKNVLYFIERIPYSETRDYVKLILRNYFYYKKWYTPAHATTSLPHLEEATKDFVKSKKIF